MATDPVDNVSLKVKALPYDENNSRLSAVVAAIVSGGEIVGYLPLKATDNSDGTATLASSVNVTLDADVDIGNINLLNIAGTKVDPATEPKQDDIIAAINALAISGVDPVGLKNIAAAAINPATEDTLAAIKTQTDKFKFIGDSLDVTESVATALAADPSSAIGTRLKHYNQQNDIADNPVVFNVKADMDTLYSQTDSKVRFLLLTKPTFDVTIKITSVDGTSEDILVEKNEVFNVSSFDIVSFEITVSQDNTDLRLLAEGFGG